MTNQLKQALKESSNVTVNHKGATSYKSSLNKCVDLFGKIGSMRARSDQEVIDAFTAAFAEDEKKALKILFWARDIRGGAGERKVPRTIFAYLAKVHRGAIARNLSLIPEYGRWDDLFVFRGTQLWSLVKEFICDQLSEDISSDSPSLLAKWMPSINTSSADSRELAREFAHKLRLSHKQYRKMLSGLRAKLNVIEREMCSGNWTEIDYEKVPSRAAMIYRNAFLSHDMDKYSEYLSRVENGEAKINTGTLYPYDLIRKIQSNNIFLTKDVAEFDKTISLQWDNLPNYVKPFNGMVLADFSASMLSSSYYGGNNKNNVRPYDVAASLSVYIAERNEGVWKNCFMPFSSEAEIVELQGKNIFEKVSHLNSFSSYWGSTNLQAAFDLILKTAVENEVKKEDMVETLFIVSDMQFDAACKAGTTNFQIAKRKFEQAGYKFPNVVFWNVAAYSDLPVTKDEAGTSIISGASPAILEAVLAGEVWTPEDMMNRTIESERYAAVK